MIHAPKRRWSRFSLRWLFAALTMIGIIAGWIASNVHQVNERERVIWSLARIVDQRSATGVPAIQKYFGAFPVRYLQLYHDTTDDDLERTRNLFPEAEVERNPASF